MLAATEMLKDHPRIRWLLVGDGRMAHWMGAQIAQRKLQNNVPPGLAAAVSWLSEQPEESSTGGAASALEETRSTAQPN
jgi:hypothetical protein